MLPKLCQLIRKACARKIRVPKSCSTQGRLLDVDCGLGKPESLRTETDSWKWHQMWQIFTHTQLQLYIFVQVCVETHTHTWTCAHTHTLTGTDTRARTHTCESLYTSIYSTDHIQMIQHHQVGVHTVYTYIRQYPNNISNILYSMKITFNIC